MNNELEKNNPNNKLNISKKGKTLIIVLGSILLVGIIVFYILPMFIYNRDTTKKNEVVPNIFINNNKGVTEKKELNGLSFEKTSLVYKGGLSKLVTTVTNNTTEDYAKEKIIIIIKDKNDKEITTINGYFSSVLKPGESQKIESYVDLDLSNRAYLIEYKESE